MSSDATVSDDNLPARPVLKDAPTVAERQDVDAMPARGSVIPSNARQRAAWPGRARVGGAADAYGRGEVPQVFGAELAEGFLESLD